MLKKTHKIIFYIFIFAFTTNAFSQDKIAFIDLNFILNNSSAGKKINKELKTKTEKIASEFKDIQNKIEKEKKKISAQKNVISKEEYNKMIIDLENDIKKYNSSIQKKQNNLAKYKNQVRSEFSNQLKTVLEEYSKENSISMILRKENLLIGKNTLDVTNDILNLFNKNVKTIKVQ